MSNEIDHISQMVNLIRNGNGSNIFITADHGYIYQNEALDETDFSDFKVMGNTIIQDSRRFVIGRNLQPGDAVRTWTAEEVGLKGNSEANEENGSKKALQIQIAKGLNRIRKQGAADSRNTAIQEAGRIPLSCQRPLPSGILIK